ncbi:hypothetical protein [Pseudoalteromonas denitrificans]|uniref:Uncharacterized protein n=1 Tax=Pseudoalteromonas denitrificans DSM 6059 TaxID=1123010 RepID=A0A1I1JHC0_9GAMM|nr:hypothetical protein [Pseudoalteromonas denitrificans]SFC47561.1 hypothetical protein SAMN02745724_01740 [Pseudoalteromonas denitrificans DSM 6059]
MNITNIGQIFNYLAEHKVIRSYEKKGIRRSTVERELAKLLDNHLHRLDDLDEFLSTQGMQLKTLNTQEYGIANQGRVYVLIRQLGENESPAHLQTKQVWEMFKGKSRKDTQKNIVIWTSYLYLHLLHFLYTLDNRPVEGISAFGDTWIDHDIFKEDIIKSIDELRQSKASGPYAESKIYECLCNFKDTEITTRVGRFFTNLIKFGILEQVVDTELRMSRSDTARVIYRQTLWSAVDVAENFNRYASLLIQAPTDNKVYQLSKVSS